MVDIGHETVSFTRLKSGRTILMSEDASLKSGESGKGAVNLPMRSNLILYLKSRQAGKLDALV